MLDDHIHRLLQSAIGINAILDRLPIGADRRNRRLQIMRNVLNHLLLLFVLTRQFGLHITQRIGHVADLIPPVNVELRRLIVLDPVDVGLDLVQRHNDRCHPDHQNHQQHRRHHDVQIHNVIDQLRTELPLIGIRHQRHKIAPIVQLRNTVVDINITEAPAGNGI